MVRHTEKLLKIIQPFSFVILLAIYVTIAALQGYKLFFYKTEGMTFSFLVSGSIFTIVIFYLSLEAYRKSRAEKQLRLSVIGNGIGALGACLGVVLFYRACTHENLPLWTTVDSAVVFRIIVGSCIVFFIGVLCRLHFYDRVLIGFYIGLLMGANQIGVANAIEVHGREGIFLGTIIGGYLLPCVRLVMLIPSAEVKEEVGKKLPSRREKFGIVIAECMNITTWSYVTYEFVRFS